MRKYISTGEVSEMMKISPRTLRYYDKIGLLCPAYSDPKGGREKFYSYGQLEALTIIMLCSEMGLSSKEMRAIAAQQGANTFSFLMDAGVKLAKSKIESLRNTMLQIESFNEQVERIKLSNVSKGIYRRLFDTRCVAILPCGESDDAEALDRKSTELYTKAAEYGIALSYHGGVVGISNGESIGWFVYLDALEERDDADFIIHLPPGNYDCRIVPNAESRAAYIAATCSAEGYDFKKGSIVIFSELYDYQSSVDNKTEIQIFLQRDKKEPKN